MPLVTVVFADLCESTGVFESLGNAKATQAITRLTHWIGTVCTSQNGQVVKNLGDGVLMVFQSNVAAVDAVMEMQREHTERIRSWPEQLQMRLKIGMARGDVVVQDGDYFGDAVNVAARLSDLSGPDQILGTESVIDGLPSHSTVRSRCMGAIPIRGREEACVVYRIEWQSDMGTEFFTMPASLTPSATVKAAHEEGVLQLTWLDTQATFTSAEVPVYLGRSAEAQFMVSDPRVSRLHAKISWQQGKFFVEDVSSFGTWIRFDGSREVISLRRTDCVLLASGEFALGAAFEDLAIPIVSFSLPR